jgi:hypothetical protein
MPGEVATIHVVFHSKGFWRGVEKKVFIISDDASKPVRTVTLLGYVRIGTRLDINTVNLGHGVFGEKLRPVSVHVFADAGVDESTPHLVGGSPGLGMLAGKWKPVDAGQAQRCTLSIGEKPITQLPGTYSTAAFVAVGRGVRLPLHILYTVRPVVSCDPPEVVLRWPATGPARAFLNYGGHYVHIDSISSASGYCTARLAGAEPGGAELRISRNSSGRKLKATAIDVLRVEYFFGRGTRHERLSIPVVLER